MAGAGDSGEEEALRRRYEEDRASRHGRAAAGGGSSHPQASDGERRHTATKVDIPSCRLPLAAYMDTGQFWEDEAVGPFCGGAIVIRPVACFCLAFSTSSRARHSLKPGIPCWERFRR